MSASPTRQRVAWFATICVAALALVIWSLRSTRAPDRLDAEVSARPTSVLAAAPARPFVLARQLASGDGWGRLAVAPLDGPDGPRFVTPLTCLRAYASGGRGLCLASDGATSRAIVFDDRFEARHTLPLTGPPSRARVSRDGRLGAVTVFEAGHSYADAAFSTRTTILDLERGAAVADLESFAVWQGGQRLRRVDVNFWGVTFAPDGRHFYATLAFGGTPYLVEGDLDARSVRVLAPHVECPSLSPDGRRVAFKRTEGLRWRLWVRDLGSGAERIVAGETRSIDDQVEWLDDHQLLYQFPSDDGNNVWAVQVDGNTPSRRFMRDAWSPAVVR